LPEDQTKNPKYFLNRWSTKGTKKAGSRGQGAQSSGHRHCRPKPSSESEALAKDSAKAWHTGRKRWAGSRGQDV